MANIYMRISDPAAKVQLVQRYATTTDKYAMIH